MSDTIFVNGLLIHAHHGVMAHEEKVGQRFMIDLELAIDLAPAGRSDKLADTVSYSAIVETVTFAGDRFETVLQVGDERVSIYLPRDRPARAGEVLSLRFPSDGITLWQRTD